MSATRPRVLFFGTGGGSARACLVDSGTTDAGLAYEVLFQSNPITPAQPSRMLACFATYLVVTATDTDAPTTLVARLLVDDEPALAREFVVDASSGDRQQRFEIAWRHLISSGGLGRLTLAPRGYKIVLQIASASALPAGRIVVDGGEFEIEELGEDISSLANA